MTQGICPTQNHDHIRTAAVTIRGMTWGIELCTCCTLNWMFATGKGRPLVINVTPAHPNPLW